MQDFSYLSTLADDDFEREREQLICDVIESASPEHRAMLRSLQSTLDVLREQITTEEFLQLCCTQLLENLQKLQVTVTELQTLLPNR